MAELLLELLTEEIPARMQGVAAEELRRLTEIAFNEAHLSFAALTSYVTPRRPPHAARATCARAASGRAARC